MRRERAEDYLDWLWNRLKQEPELRKALDEMVYIKRVRMEHELLNELMDY